MKEVMGVLAPIALTVGIGCLVGGIIGFIVSLQMMKDREIFRELRVALERDPTPGQLAEARRRWPDTGQFSGNMLKGEYVKRAHQEEMRKADRAEKIKGWVRSLFFVAVIGVALFFVGNYVKNMPEPAPQPTQTEETP